MFKYVILSSGLLLLPITTYAAFTINTNVATSSNNIIFNSFNTGGELGIYKNPETVNPNANWGMIAGSCSSTGAGRYECETGAAPTTGQGIKYHFGGSLELGDGSYTLFSGSTNCYNVNTISGCAATGNQQQDFQICSDGSCLNPTSTMATSTVDYVALNNLINIGIGLLELGAFAGIAYIIYKLFR